MRKKARPAKRGRPLNSWIPDDARVAPLRCPILRLRKNHCNNQKHVNHPLTDESVSGIGWAPPTNHFPCRRCLLPVIRAVSTMRVLSIQ